MMFDSYYIGYSLDAVLEAVSAATNGERVCLVATGKLGSPLDTYGDMVSSSYADILNSILSDQINFTEYMNPRFYYIPYDKVKIKNNSNGAIQYPLSGKSFDSKEECESMRAAFNSPEVQEIVDNKTSAPSKFVTVVKNKFPKAFADTFVKPMQSIRWRGIPLSQFSMLSFNYEFCLDHVNDDNYNEYFSRPDVSYTELCEMICRSYGITIENADLARAKEIITDRTMAERVVLMDNRVDQIFDYMCGKFDRSAVTVEDIMVPQQLIHARDGLYYTPLSDCCAITVFDGKAKKFKFTPINTLYTDSISEIPSTKANIKMYAQYSDLISHYGNKKLDLAQRIETLIK